MALRAVGISGIALGILAMVCTSPARAVPIEIDLTISYDPTAAGELNGTAQFSLVGQIADVPVGDAIDIGPLSPGKNFFISFEPPDPCISLTSCQISFSFGGSAGEFTAFAFLPPGPPNFPPGPPNIPIADFAPPDPCSNGAACNATGPIVADDSPVVVGEWTTNISAETPLPSALVTFPSGICLLGWLTWRRKRKVAAALAA